MFNNVESISKADIMSQLFIGALGPVSGSVPIAGEGFTAHVVQGSVNERTVFEVIDRGGILFLKNARSTVSLVGTPASSFRNPPHFMSLIADSSCPGTGE